MSQINFSRYKYIPDEIDEKTFLEKFVVRLDTFEEIYDDIKDADYTIPSQHYIIVGQRGQGKTSLLRKIQLEVKKDKELSKFLLPIKFAEEQYQVRTLCRLWELVAEELQVNYEDEFESILDELEEFVEDDDYDLRCFEYFERRVKEKNKKLLILIDNIDDLFGKLKEKEQRQLREIMLNSSTFRIIGGSTKMIEQHYDYSKPFYEFFNVIKLKGLDYEESIRFLQTIAKDDEKEKIAEIIKNSPQRVETIRQLTGGVPRTLVMLYEIFINDESNSFEDLIKILNDATPLYKDRMDQLPATLQDIVHNIAINWDGITTKELAKKTRLSSANVSSQLKQLEKYQIVEYESAGKNKIYKISERFFNIWYLMRYGRKKDRNKVEWLVKFLTAWYSRDELEVKASTLIDSLKNKKLNEAYVYHICEALSYAGIDMKTEYEMKQSVKKYLEDAKSEFAKELSTSDRDVLKKAFQLQDDGKIDEAIRVIEKSKKTTVYIYVVLGILYSEQNKYEKAEEYYLKAIDAGETTVLDSLSFIYFAQGKKLEASMKLIKQSYELKKGFFNIFVYAVVLLWAEEYKESYTKFIEYLEYKKAIEVEKYVNVYLNLLISKGQYYKAKEFLEMPKYELKDRYKPIWYALMSLMQDDFPNEIKKMGSELNDVVDSVLKKIEFFKERYKV